MTLGTVTGSLARKTVFSPDLIRGNVVIDGACRDIDSIRAIGFPVYGRAVVPVTARRRLVQESFNTA